MWLSEQDTTSKVFLVVFMWVVPLTKYLDAQSTLGNSPVKSNIQTYLTLIIHACILVLPKRPLHCHTRFPGVYIKAVVILTNCSKSWRWVISLWQHRKQSSEFLCSGKHQAWVTEWLFYSHLRDVFSFLKTCLQLCIKEI